MGLGSFWTNRQEIRTPEQFSSTTRESSPLYGMFNVPPIRVHVGDGEVLLDDSVRFVDRALTAGVDTQLDIWEGMVHGFPGSVGQLSASTQALQQIGSFVSQCFVTATAKR